MKRIIPLAVAALALPLLVFSQSPRKGPLIDRLVFDVKTQEEAALKDTAEGRSDLFLSGVPKASFDSLTPDLREKLDTYETPAGTWYLAFNPYPNRPPYTAAVGTRTYFNPFAIRDVRRAVSLLIDRGRIVDEILGGAGGPLFTVAPPPFPGSYRFTLLAARLGFTAAGDEEKALGAITAALQRAAELPANKGKLERRDDGWFFDDDPVTVRFLIRVDDPDGRLKEGRYVADQIEKAGIKVERLEYDRKKCFAIYQDGNPASYEWNIYTEAYGLGNASAWWDEIVAQNYAPWASNMPGSRIAGNWNYENPEIDALTRRAVKRSFATEQEYWDAVLRAQELGLAEAVRIPVCYQDELVAAARARMAGRMAAGAADGVDGWSFRTADVKGKGGEKVLRVSLFSARGTLFANAWDPVGPDGFADANSLSIASALTDAAAAASPVSGAPVPVRAMWSDVLTRVHAGKDEDGREVTLGDVPVPPDALRYDSATQTWKKVGPGVTSFARATYSYRWGRWHTGRPVTVADVMYGLAFARDWMTRDGSDDKRHDAAYEAAVRPRAEKTRGLVLNKDGTLTVWYDLLHPGKDDAAAQAAPWVGASATSRSVAVPWEVLEALGRLVSEGGASGTSWSFSADPAFTEVDLLDPSCLADLKAKLLAMKAARSVPASVKKWVTAADAVAGYEAAIKWIEAHKNAYISNGPFFLDTVDRAAGIIECAANRDPGYPFETGYWNRQLRSRSPRMDSITAPQAPARGKDATFTVKLSSVEFPSGAVKAADSTARVKLTLVLPAGEKSYKGAYAGAGSFAVKIPASDMGMEAGTYPVIVESTLAGEEPAVEVSALVMPE